MLNITFGTETFNDIPESYEETNLGRFIEVMKLQKKEEEFKSKTLFTANVLAAIIGCEVEYILELDSDELGELADAFSWLSSNPEIKEMTHLVIDDITYVLKKNTKLTLGEQVSIETFLQNDLSNVENFHLVMAILLRPGYQKEDPYTKELVWHQKPLEDDYEEVVKRADMFKDRLMISEIYGTLTAFSAGVKKSSTKILQGSSHLKIVRRSQNS